VKELRQGLENGAKDSILLAHWESQSYFAESYTDLYDFCDRLEKYCSNKTGSRGILSACERVKEVLQSDRPEDDPKGEFDRLVVFTDYFGPSYQHSNGLSIYFPWRSPTTKVRRNYRNYEFTKKSPGSSWLDFLDDYFYLTKRPLKGAEKATREPIDTTPAQRPLKADWEKSDAQLLKLGPPPRHKKRALVKALIKLAEDLEKRATDTGSLSETNKETATLSKELGTLAENFRKLAAQIGTLAGSGKELGTLAKELGTLEKELGSLAKETGTLAEAEKETATLAKETASLAKETATLAKETATLAKETATLAASGKETATLAKEMGTLAKETGTLAKEMATLGLLGITVVKNFDAPEVPITSRPKGDPNKHRWETGV
jgi:hypothetical protein